MAFAFELGSPAASVVLGLIAATTWGGSDFAGGMGARRSPALLVAASGHLVTLLVLLVVCARSRLSFPHSMQFAEGAIGGLEGSLALAAFYRALAMGSMGLTAALTGLLTALVPVLFGLWKDGLPAPLAMGGLLLGCVAIWMIAHSPGHSTPPAALLLGAVSGIGFGLQLILLKLASADGVLWALTSARLGGVAALSLVLGAIWLARRWRPVKAERPEAEPGLRLTGFWRMGILAGVLDTIGNVGFTVAAQSGRLDIAAVVSSLYPGFTIILAAIVLRDRPSGRQALGMALALASVVLLSV